MNYDNNGYTVVINRPSNGSRRYDGTRCVLTDPGTQSLLGYVVGEVYYDEYWQDMVECVGTSIDRRTVAVRSRTTGKTWHHSTPRLGWHRLFVHHVEMSQ